MFRPPSHAEVVEVVVSEILGGRAIVAVRGEAGAGKTALVERTALKLRQDRRTVATADGGSASPRAILHLIAGALHIGEADALGSDVLLQRMQSWEGAERVVVIIDDADRLSASVFQTIALLVKLFSLRPTTLQVVLVGRSGQWPGVQSPELETMRRATLSLHTIAVPPVDEEAGDAGRGSGAGRWPGAVAAERLRRAGLPRRSRNRVAVAALGLLMTGIATAELIDLPDALEPSQDATTHVVGVRPSVPASAADADVPAATGAAPLPSSAGDADGSSAGGLPRAPFPEAVPIPDAKPLPTPAPSETRMAQGTPLVAEEAQSEWITSAPGGKGGPGLVLVASAGDSLPALYARVYRGLKPPPYLQVVAANRMPMKAGTLVIFPEPPAGWPVH